MNNDGKDAPYGNRKLVISGMAIGFAYGFTVRVLPRVLPAWGDPFVMTAGFTCLMPLAMGFIAVFYAEVKQAQRFSTWLLLPWYPLRRDWPPRCSPCWKARFALSCLRL